MSWKTYSAPLKTGHNVQTNAPELRSVSSQDFASPRMSKVKVIHKEKLSNLQQNISQGQECRVPATLSTNTLGVTASRAETVPTAHVSPHMTSQHCHPQASPLRRAVSTNDFTKVRFNSAQHDINSLLQKANSNVRRWNSYQNLDLDKTPRNEFHGLDLTLNESCLPKEVFEDTHYYKQNHLSCPKPGVVTLPKQSPVAVNPTNMLYGQVVATNDLLGYRRPNNELQTHMNVYPTDHYNSQPSTQNHGHTYGGVMPSKLQHGGNYELPQTQHQASTIFSQTDVYCQPPVAPDHFSTDLTTWQQRHQEQLRRQHYEATQPSTVYSSSGGGLPAGLTMPSLLDPHKLDAVKRAADSIIREKDNIIEKQKMKLLQLERHSKESEVDLHKAMLHKAHEDGDALTFRLQEVQYESAALKAQLTEVLNDKNMLEKKLGETEYELQELKLIIDRDRSTKNTEEKALQEKVTSKEKEWKEKEEKLQSDRDKLQKQVESMERYLNDLPTANDHSKKSSEVRSLKEDKAKYKSRSIDLERRLSETNKIIKQQQEGIDNLRKTEIAAKEQIDILETENKRSRRAADALPPNEEEELEELRAQKVQLQSNLEKAKKLLEAKHKKQHNIEVRYQGELKQLKERISQEEATVTALKEDLLNKDTHLKKLRASVKELNTQHQDLLEKNFSLEEHLRELEKQLTGESRKLEQRLTKEMTVCFTELQSLVQVCVERAEGQDPNISVLLGVKASAINTEENQPVGDTLQSLRYKVDKVTELRKDIDRLREIISNKYAEDMAEQLTCATQ